MFSIFLLGLVIGSFAGLFSWLGVAAFLQTLRMRVNEQTAAGGQITPHAA
jgi:hypothetical protein